MATAEERLELAADKAENASDIAYEWANGPENTYVTTASGELPTLAEFLRLRLTDVDGTVSTYLDEKEQEILTFLSEAGVDVQTLITEKGAELDALKADKETLLNSLLELKEEEFNETLDGFEGEWDSALSELREAAGNLVEEGADTLPIRWHSQTVSANTNIPANMNAWSVGPVVTIAAGTTVSVGEGSFWTIVNGQATPSIAVPDDYDEGELD